MAKRTITAIVLLTVSLGAILAGNPLPTMVLLYAVALLGAMELSALTGTKTLTAYLIIFCLFTTAPLLDFWLGYGLIVVSLFWVMGGVCLFIWKPNYRMVAYGTLFWVFCGSLCGIALQQQSIGSGSFAPNLLLLAIAPLWVGDSAAYFIGKAWGKHKLAPTISPNKTVEGAVANLLGCLLAAFALGAWLKLSVPVSLAVGLSTGVFGQVGDLLQSRLKRRADVKDSGSLLPGHGGVLDRLDSFLFSSFPTLLAIYLINPELFHVKQWPLWAP